MNTFVIIAISVFSGFVFAFLLYHKQSSWSTRTNIAMATLRFFTVSIMVFMLLTPFIKSKSIVTEKSTFVIALDNSTSVKDALEANSEVFIANIEKIRDQLGDRFDVKIFTLDGLFSGTLLKDLKFDKAETDISSLFSFVDNSLESSDLKGVVLFTDGIVNKGTSPLFNTFNCPVFTVGIGDTTKPKDLVVKNCVFNNIVGKGNKFPINIEIKAYNLKGKRASVSIYAEKKKINTQTINIVNDEYSVALAFENIENEAGLKHYTIVADAIKGEFSIKNNQKDIYFDVIEAKQKIALLAAAPHPDIKAIMSSLNNGENVEIQSFIEGINQFKNDNFDLIIAYQLPGLAGSFNAILNSFEKSNTPILYIVGSNTNLQTANLQIPNVKILSPAGQFDKVSAILNPSYTSLNFDQGLASFLDKSPPLVVPFGEYNLGSGWNIILKQKVGTIATEKPLLAIFVEEGKKYGVFFGEGIWQWRMNEFAENKNTVVFDDFIKKVSTLLAQKTDKRKFRCNTTEKRYEQNVPVVFKIETYNDIYQPIFDQNFDLTLKDESKKILNFKFSNSVSNPNFELTGLKAGLYTYTCKTILSGKELSIKGEFSIQDLDLESNTKIADFELLRNIANKTNAKHYDFRQMKNLAVDFEGLGSNNKVYQIESNEEVINFKILLLVLICLVATEWFMRKFLGQG
ncbi:MAG: hypothetical protein ACKVOU_12840 [Cytophagales bacterium]